MTDSSIGFTDEEHAAWCKDIAKRGEKLMKKQRAARAAARRAFTKISKAYGKEVTARVFESIGDYERSQCDKKGK